MIKFFHNSDHPVYASSHYARGYADIPSYLSLVVGLCLLLASLAYFLSLSTSIESEKTSEYECGFAPLDSATRLPFDVHFYLVGILFLIFDVEIALLFPWALSLRLCGWFGFFIVLFFVFLLGVGFIYEWKRGALIWPSKAETLTYQPTNVLPNEKIGTVDLIKQNSSSITNFKVQSALILWLQIKPIFLSEFFEETTDVLLCIFYFIVPLKPIDFIELLALILFCFTTFYFAGPEFLAARDWCKECIDKYFEDDPYNIINNLSCLFFGLLYVYSRLLNFFMFVLIELIKLTVTLIQWICRFISIFIDVAVNIFNACIYLPDLIILFGVVYAITIATLNLSIKTDKLTLVLKIRASFCRIFGLALALYFIHALYGNSAIYLNGYIFVSPLISTIKFFVLATGLFVLVYSKPILVGGVDNRVEFPLLFGLALFFMVLLVGSNNLILSFLAIAGFSLNIYVLLLYNPVASLSREATVKYYYLSAVSSGLMLFGIFLIFFIFRTTQLDEIELIISGAGSIYNITNGWLLQQALFPFLLGLFFKLGAFPSHLWAADVYEGSSDPVIALFMLPSKIATLGFLTILLSTTLGEVSESWQFVISLAAAISLIWGCFGAFNELRVKRFLAYTSINQMGFLLLGLSTAWSAGYLASLQYLFVYLTINLGFFLVFLNIETRRGDSLRFLTDLCGLHKENKVAAEIMTLTFFSAAGIPPLIGFFGKYDLLKVLMISGNYGLAIIAVVTSLVSVYYYLRVIKLIWFENSDLCQPTVKNLTVTPQSVFLVIFLELVLWGVPLLDFVSSGISFLDDTKDDVLKYIKRHVTSAFF